MSYRPYDSLFHLLQGVCRRHGIAFYPDQIRFAGLWRKVVGPYVRRNTEIRRFQKGIAWIRTPSPTWRFELTQMKAPLIDRLNQAYGRPFVKDLRFEIGPVIPKEETPETEAREGKEAHPRVLRDDEAAWVRRCVEEISDPSLRRRSEKVLARFLLKSLHDKGR